MGLAGGTAEAPCSSPMWSHQLEKPQDSALPLNGFIWELGKTHKNYLKSIPWT